MENDNEPDRKHFSKKFREEGCITFKITKHESKLIKKIIMVDLALEKNRNGIRKLITYFYIIRGIFLTAEYMLFHTKVMTIFEFYVLNKHIIKKVEKKILENNFLEMKFIMKNNEL